MPEPPIVIDPDSIVTASDVTDRRPEQDVYEDADVNEILSSTAPPKVLVTSNNAWNDRYLAGLRSGDWVTTTGAGYEKLPIDRFEEMGVMFTHMPGNNAPQVAEHAIAMALSYTRQLWQFREQQRERKWNKISEGMTHLAGERCCIVGQGQLGEAVARRVRAFDMTVHGVKRSTNNYTGNADSIYAPAELHDALGDARLVVISLPLTDETHHLIGKAELDRTADDAIVVNVGRGPVLETDALLAALEERSIRAACLDVTDPEPLSTDSPLWDKDDVLITAHSGSQSDKRAQQFLDEFLEMFDQWRSGNEPGNRVV